MTIKFKSQATGDLVMVQSHAESVLQVLGKSASEPGILEPKDMAQALRLLKGLPHDAPHPPDPAGDLEEVLSSNAKTREEPEFADQFVSLHQRAVPLVRMIERSLLEDKPVVWGV